MRFDPIFEPISDDQPCGPDLEIEGDDGFMDYYYEAMARLPERYLDTATGEAFDRKSVDLKAEVKAIGELLDRSRDLRLLVLEAQFQILAGQFPGFVDCVVAVARLVEERWDDVHPRVEADPTDRRNTIELLDSRATVIMPLEDAPLFRDRRLDQVAWRAYSVGAGKQPARGAGDSGDASAILGALQSAENADAVTAAFEQLAALRQALKTIVNACRGSGSTAFSPTISGLTELVGEMYTLFVEARPDLAADAGAETGDDADAADGDGPAIAAPRTAGPSGPVPAITSHAVARAALAVAESYFGRIEPSSPAFFLVRQARLLIGRPLVEALETLLPELADKARIGFGSDAAFAMSMGRMKSLSGELPKGADAEAQLPGLLAESREDATALLTAVEGYFRQTEPSSPIPVLLFKAKTYLNRDFAAILGDLFPAKP